MGAGLAALPLGLGLTTGLATTVPKLASMLGLLGTAGAAGAAGAAAPAIAASEAAPAVAAATAPMQALGPGLAASTFAQNVPATLGAGTSPGLLASIASVASQLKESGLLPLLSTAAQAFQPPESQTASRQINVGSGAARALLQGTPPPQDLLLKLLLLRRGALGQGEAMPTPSEREWRF
jgi:hypothetical protein